jgi:hypothetical protein
VIEYGKGAAILGLTPPLAAPMIMSLPFGMVVASATR